jgi:hypothetical protein
MLSWREWQATAMNLTPSNREKVVFGSALYLN